MSFSKAKIHRFNDDKPCAPPPGAYNPEKIDKSVGPVIHKTERFADNNKGMIHASSTDSINSLSSEKGTSSTSSFATFKTPKIPSTYRAISRTDIRKKDEFSRLKAASTDYINKKSSAPSNCEMNPLKYSVRMLQDELIMEKKKNEQLIAELTLAKDSSEESTSFSDYLIDIINEKNKIIDFLTQKCNALEQFSTESFESYQGYVKNLTSVFETHFRLSSETDHDVQTLMERYENLVSEYEQDLENLFIFLVDLQQKQNIMVYDSARLNGSSEQCNILIETLKETERGRRKYEIIVREMQKVINVLSRRVHESDTEVEKMYKVVESMNEDKTKLWSNIQDKEVEITTMRDIINAMNKKFFNEVHNAENNLLSLVDKFKAKATSEKENYETTLNQKDSMIMELLKAKNEKELQLQESLDLIEILKCKEENLQQTFNQLQKDLGERCAMFEEAYKECCKKLTDLENTYEIGAEKTESYLEDFGKHKNDFIIEHAELVKRILESLIQKNLLNSDVTNEFEGIKDTGKLLTKLQELFPSDFMNNEKDKTEVSKHLIDTVFVNFSKFINDINALRTDSTRLRNDFIEKCDECGQLTRLLQLSEKNLEVSETKTNDLLACQNSWDEKFKEYQKKIDLLESENLNLKQQLSFESNMKESELIFENAQGETTLENTKSKVEELEQRNIQLENLIGSYRSQLEKFENERKIGVKKGANSFRKNSKLLTQKHQDLKTKEEKPKIGSLHSKKVNQELLQKPNILKGGKENQACAKKNEIFEIKKPITTEISVNSTYIVTSPKVNRI